MSDTNSSLVKSISLRKLRPLRFIMIPSEGCGARLRRVAHEGAGHTTRTATSPTELFAGDGDNFDTVLAQHGVGGDIAFVSHDDTGSDGQVVRTVVPLLSLGGPDVLVGGEDLDLVTFKDIGQFAPEFLVALPGESGGRLAGLRVQLRRCRSKN